MRAHQNTQAYPHVTNQMSLLKHTLGFGSNHYQEWQERAFKTRFSSKVPVCNHGDSQAARPAFKKGTLVKAVFVDVSQLTKLTVYYRSLQAILPKHSVLAPYD